MKPLQAVPTQQVGNIFLLSRSRQPITVQMHTSITPCNTFSIQFKL